MTPEQSHEEPDYPTAAHAWLALEMTKENMRHNNECYRLAVEFARRLDVERSQDTKQEA